ncbi:MAG: 7TM diverse intracellular signaling domain-containing protein [Nitrospirota bacterium]
MNSRMPDELKRLHLSLISEISILLIFSFCQTLLAEDIITSIDNPFQIDIGKFRQGDNPDWASKDIDDSSWEEIIIPDNWNKTRKSYHGIGWYRFRVKITEGLKGKPLSILLLKSTMTHALYFNGDLIGKSGRFDPPALTWNYPALYNIPHSIIQYGKYNIIAIRLFGFKNSLSGIHSPLLITDTDRSQAIFDRRIWFQVYSSQVLSFLLLAVSIYHLMLFYKRPRDQAYLYFGICCLLGAIGLSNNFLKNIPVSYMVWNKILLSLIAIFVHLFLIFTLRYLGEKKRNIELINLIIGSIGLLSLSFAASDNFIFVSNCWFLFSILILIYIIYILIRAYLRGNRESYILIAGVIIGSLVGVNDLLIKAGILSASHPLLLRFGIPLILLAIAFSMANQFARVCNQHERLSRELDSMVKERTQQLQRAYEDLQKAQAKILKIERESVLQKERSRLIKEIHDGIGAELSNIILLNERIKREIKNIPLDINGINNTMHKMEQHGQDCLFEMRNTIWAIDPEDSSYGSLIAHIRRYCSEISDSAGIRFKFIEEGMTDNISITPEVKLNTFRVVQEAMRNIIKHAHTDSVTITFTLSENILEFTITDRGVGFDIEEISDGYGLTNMKERMKAVLGNLTIDSLQNNGTKITGNILL